MWKQIPAFILITWRLVAVAAFERFLSSMRPLVHYAAAAPCERLGAVVAFEWSLSGMRPLVNCAAVAL